LKKFRPLLAVLTAALAAVLWVLRPHRPVPSVPSFPLSDFSSVDARTEKPLGLKDLKGRPWLAGFVFTRCGGPCPRITARMAGLQKELPAEVRFVTFTVDPVFDTPAVLRRYAEEFKADPDRWSFLRVEPESVQGLLREGFRLPYGQGNGKDPSNAVIHTAKLVLVDGEGRVRGFYEPSDAYLAARLREDLKKLSS
jgi:protein SCO1